MDPISAGIAGIGALAKIWQGFSQKHQAHKINKNNPFPTEQANPLYAQNLAIAENAAKVGLPQQQVIQAQQGFARSQNAGLRQLGRIGRPGGVAGVVRAGNDAALGLGVADAQARMTNQRQTYGMRNQLANEQTRVWDWNNRQPFLAKTAQAQALLGAGQQNRMAGFNDLQNIGLYSMMGNQGNGNNYQSQNNTATNPMLLQQQFNPGGYGSVPYKFNYKMPGTPFNYNQGFQSDYQY